MSRFEGTDTYIATQDLMIMVIPSMIMVLLMASTC